jgi:hypothetical protein
MVGSAAIALIAVARGAPVAIPDGWSAIPAREGHFDADGVDVVPSEPRPLVDDPTIAPLEPSSPGAIRLLMSAWDERLAGARASPVFRDEVASMDVYWTFAAAGVPQRPLDHDDAQAALDLLVLSGGMALGDVVDTTLRRSDVFSAVDDALRAIGGPTLTWSPGRQTHALSLAPTDPRDRNPRLARAAFTEPTVARGPGRPPSPRVRVGTALAFRGLDDPASDRPVDAVAFVSGDNAGFRAWRVTAYSAAEAWETSVREPLVPGIDLAATVRSGDKSAIPARFTASAIHMLGARGREDWQVRAYASRQLAVGDVAAEDRIGVELRARWPWQAPQSPDRAPPGFRWDRDGPEAAGAWDAPVVVVPEPALDQ